MSPRTIMIVVLALVFSGSAAIGVNQLLSQKSEAKEETVPVVVALLDVPRGQMLTPEMVKIVQRPKSQVQEGTLDKLERAEGRAVFTPLYKDEAILNQKLAPKGAGGGMSPLIPKGMRAITIRTPSIDTAVAGFILPGNRVDVLLTMSYNGNPDDDEYGGASTNILLQNMEILAVDQLIDSPAANKVDAGTLRSVTLLATPEQAMDLELGQNKGVLHLVLRNLEDGEDSAVDMVASLNRIRGKKNAPNKKSEQQIAAEAEPVVKEVVNETDKEVPVAVAPEAPPAPRAIEMQIKTFRGVDHHPIQVRLYQAPTAPSR